MLDEYIGGRIAVARTTPCGVASNSDLLYMIVNKKQDKCIAISVDGKTGEIEAIKEQPLRLHEPEGKIIQFRKLKKEE